MRLLLRALGLDYHVHGFRSTFKSWILDHMKHLLDVLAATLAWITPSATPVGEAYRDTDLISHRRILNKRHCAFLTDVAYTGPFEVPALSLVDNTA